MTISIQDLYWVLDQQLSPTQKLLLCAIILHNNKTVGNKRFAQFTGALEMHVHNALEKLTDDKLIAWIGNAIVFTINNNIYKVINDDYTETSAVKKDNPVLDKARAKLEQMRMVGFVGEETAIFKFSLEYDKLCTQYMGKSRTSMPPAPRAAKASKNWECFKSAFNIVKDRQFNPILYLKAQFEVFAEKKHFGIMVPYPSMLSSKWAIGNYVNYIKTNISVGEDYKLLMTEEDTILETMKASHTLVQHVVQANPELSLQQCLMLSCDSLSPAYLACSKEYLQVVNSSEQPLDEDLVRLLVRFKNNPTYRDTVKRIYQEVIRV